MYSILISICAAAGVDAALWVLCDSPVWGAILGVVAFFASQAVIGVKIKGRVTSAMLSVQAILADGQKKLQEKMARWRFRPPGSMKEAQREIARDQEAFVKAALAETEKLRQFKNWVPLMERQIATAQFQLYWMLKDFAKVDELLPKAILVDGIGKSMKLARMFTKGEKPEELAKFYEKAVKRGRYNENALLAATWSWILVSRKDYDGAFKCLTEALKNSDDATLKANHLHLMNNRPAHFSNAGFGDKWYALYLEEPRVRQERQRMQWK